MNLDEAMEQDREDRIKHGEPMKAPKECPCYDEEDCDNVIICHYVNKAYE